MAATICFVAARPSRGELAISAAHFVALAAMATLVGLSAILLGAIAKVAIAIYHPVGGRRIVRWLARGRPLEWLVFSGAALAASGLVTDLMLALHWILVGGPMEQSVHLTFVTMTACVAGVIMVMSGFVLKLLLDNLDDRHAF